MVTFLGAVRLMLLAAADRLDRLAPRDAVQDAEVGWDAEVSALEMTFRTRDGRSGVAYCNGAVVGCGIQEV
jgi:hypothetical protein